MLTRELEVKCETISELETEVERLRGNQPDSAKLLATMESDKVAAAAAVRQNMEMKEQVEGMKEVIAKMVIIDFSIFHHAHHSLDMVVKLTTLLFYQIF